MKEKLILRSSARDLHGLTTNKDLLLQAVDAINSPLKMRQLINHRRDYPPIGYLDNAELIEKEDIDLVVAEPFTYLVSEGVKWDSSLIEERPSKPIQFKKRTSEPEKLNITLDPNNFKSTDSFKNTVSQLKSSIQIPIIIKTDTRKAYILEPRVIITLAGYYSIVYPFVAPFLKKIGEKIAEDVASDVYDYSKKKLLSFTENVRKVLTITRQNTSPLNKPLEIIFEIQGEPYVELHAKSDNAENIVKAISPSQMSKVHKRIMELIENVEIAEIHFNLNEKGRWIYTYLITKDGTLIGTKSIFKKRDKLIKRINLSPTKGHSIGADVTYQGFENEL